MGSRTETGVGLLYRFEMDGNFLFPSRDPRAKERSRIERGREESL